CFFLCLDLFFFSSRRRHTRFSRDWSSDVCSSDLADDRAIEAGVRPADLGTFVYTGGTTGPSKGCMLSHNYHHELARQIGFCWGRSEERRVGEEWRARGPADL